MSQFLSPRFKIFETYTPGEQPQDKKYIKLNTNESPYPPSPKTIAAAAPTATALNLYSDPEQKALCCAASALFGVPPENILPVNGSDEALNYAFMSFCTENTAIAYPSISYGFYPVLAALHGVPAQEIPLNEDLSINPHSFHALKKTIVIANPNAPTGIALPLSQIEEIIAANPENIVIIDEAYVSFGAQSAIPLIKKYKNLLVTRTFSKSHSLAGARLGFAIADKDLIADLNIIKYSTNPYNINSMTAACGISAIETNAYYKKNCAEIIETREETAATLRTLGFQLTNSKANFLFAKCDIISGKALYTKLKSHGILVRHFDKPGISNHLRITIGTKTQMQELISAVQKILKEHTLP